MQIVGLRWVYHHVGASKSGVRVQTSPRPTLCLRGRKQLLGIMVTYPVRVFKRPVADFDVLAPVMNGGSGVEYPVEAAVEKLREIGRRNGITIGASRLLDRALEVNLEEIDEEEYADEEELKVVRETETPIAGDDDGEEGATNEAPAEGTTGGNISNDETKESTEMSVQTGQTSAGRAKAPPRAGGSKPLKSKTPPAHAAVKKASAKKAGSSTATKKAKGPREPTLRQKTEAYIKDRLSSVDKTKHADADWRQSVVEAAHKKTGLSEISSRTILRRLTK